MEKETDIGSVIGKIFSNAYVASVCKRKQNLSYDEREIIEKNFSRAIGYGILFKSSDGIEKYMKLTNQEDQLNFLKNKIAEKLSLSEQSIDENSEAIKNYIITNFKVNGYIFHASNSYIIQNELRNGLNGEGTSDNYKNELLEIDNIFKNYGNDEPLGWGIHDIRNKRSGWFYDGRPKNAMYYSDGPEWLNQFCGGSTAFLGLIDQNRRYGYTNRDYETCLEAVTSLIDKNNMSESDRQKVLSFFEEKWKLYGETTPQLMFIPVSKVTSNNEDLYRKDFYKVDMLLKDVIEGQVSRAFNACCSTSISPDELSYFDMSDLLPRFKIERNAEQKNTIEECLKILKGFSLDDLKKAKEIIDAMEQGKTLDNIQNAEKNNESNKTTIHSQLNKEDDEQEISRMPKRVCITKRIVDEKNNLLIMAGTLLNLDDYDFRYFKENYGENIQEIVMTKEDWVDLITNEALDCANRIRLLEKDSGKNFESYYLGVIPRDGRKIDGRGYGGGLPDVYNKVMLLKRDVSTFEKTLSDRNDEIDNDLKFL